MWDTGLLKVSAAPSSSLPCRRSRFCHQRQLLQAAIFVDSASASSAPSSRPHHPLPLSTSSSATLPCRRPQLNHLRRHPQPPSPASSAANCHAAGMKTAMDESLYHRESMEGCCNATGKKRKQTPRCLMEEWKARVCTAEDTVARVWTGRLHRFRREAEEEDETAASARRRRWKLEPWRWRMGDGDLLLVWKENDSCADDGRSGQTYFSSLPAVTGRKRMTPTCVWNVGWSSVVMKMNFTVVDGSCNP